jgi:2-oxoisovalerate dehydrogenase E1 component
VIDLRSIVPWDGSAALESVRRTRRLLVVHEDNTTAGFGGEVIATVVDKAGVPIAARRVARDDAYMPFRFEVQLATLPSYRSIPNTAADMLDYDVEWQAARAQTGPIAVNAIGSVPADDEVEVVEVLVKAGDVVKVGDLVAVVEATKATVEVQTTVSGKVVGIAVCPSRKFPSKRSRGSRTGAASTVRGVHHDRQSRCRISASTCCRGEQAVHRARAARRRHGEGGRSEPSV